MRSLRPLFALLLACMAGACAAAEIAAQDTKAVRGVIEAQLAAFASDDAEKAWSYASPGIQQTFGSAETFIAMVRASYPVVYRPASVAFLAPQRIDGELYQGVRMTDAEGRGWLAIYRMQRQGDKSWRIDGCQVVETKGRSI